MAAMDEGQVASREELERRVAERLDLDPPTVRSRVVTAQPLSGGLAPAANPGSPPRARGRPRRRPSAPPPR